MQNSDNCKHNGLPEVTPFHPAAKGPEQPIDEMAIAVDEIDNLAFAASMLLLEKDNNTPENRAVSTLLGAMQPHLNTLKTHCTQQ